MNTYLLGYEPQGPKMESLRNGALISVKPGVGCAAAIINGILTGSEPSCDCSGGECC